MNADEFRDYILDYIFYKYLSERMGIYANSILKADRIRYKDIKEKSKQGKEYIEAIREESLEKLGYFLHLIFKKFAHPCIPAYMNFSPLPATHTPI